MKKLKKWKKHEKMKKMKNEKNEKKHHEPEHNASRKTLVDKTMFSHGMAVNWDPGRTEVIPISRLAGAPELDMPCVSSLLASRRVSHAMSPGPLPLACFSMAVFMQASWYASTGKVVKPWRCRRGDGWKRRAMGNHAQASRAATRGGARATRLFT